MGGNLQNESLSPRDHFVNLSPGKLMGLRQITDPSGRFKVLALDQSNSFKRMLRKMHERLGIPHEPSYEEIRDAKLDMTSILGAHASAVLLDVNYGLRQAINRGSLPHGKGLVARLEASKDPGLAGELEPGWSVEKAKRMGAAAAKLLVYMDVEDARSTDAQLRFVQQISDDCSRHDILLMIEELSYPRAGEDKDSADYALRRVRNIIESARLLGPYADVLKLEFPGDLKRMRKAKIERNLQELNEAAIRPWVLLSAGADFGVFIKQVKMAMQAGASGIMAGRAIFKEYFDYDTPEARREFLATTGVKRMRMITRIVDRYATPWHARYNITVEDLEAVVKPDWFLEEAPAPTCSTEAGGEY